MKIGIIGSGNMGRSLGLTFKKNGHDVFFGSRNEKDIEFIKRTAKASLPCGSLREALAYGDVVLYSLRSALPSSVAAPAEWAGKVIIDCNNGEIPPDFNFPPVIRSFAEKYQEDVPQAKVVKAFNTMAQEVYNHDLKVLRKSGAISMYAGNDPEAKVVVARLISEIGLKPIDAGALSSSRLLESFADLVRLLMIQKGGGPFLTFASNTLPFVDTGRLGTRQDTKYK
jgi:8-hydroxy-5-deazaflavin:NADPH oxidoreductase